MVHGCLNFSKLIEVIFKMVKFAKITKMTVNIIFPQGVEGPKMKKNCFFPNDTKSLKCGSLGVFGPSDGILGSPEQKKAQKSSIYRPITAKICLSFFL